MKKISRREFISRSSTAVIGTGIAIKEGRAGARVPAKSSRVVEVTHPAVVDENRVVDENAVKAMLGRGMTALTGEDRPWGQFLKKSDRVGLKINCLGRPLLYTHKELIQTVIDELVDFGIKPNNIIVWDRWQHHMLACDFELNTSGNGVRCYGTEDPRNREANRIDPEVFFESENDYAEERQGGTTSRFSSIFTKECDKVINLAILKDHGLSGVTLTLKNLAYGICDNNNRFHRSAHIGRFIADFCAMPQVGEKATLHMIDGLEACFDKGPVPDSRQVMFTPRTLWIGTDPVALDTIGFKVIDEERERRGLPPLADTPGYHEGMRPVDHIKLAARNGLGVADLDHIEVVEVKLG